MYLKDGYSDKIKKNIVQWMKSSQIEVPPYQSSVAVLIEQKKFKEAEELLKQIQQKKEVDENGISEFARVYEEVAEMEDATKLLQEWHDKNRKSPYATSLLGLAFIKYAWEGRGSGMKITVTNEGFKLFEERMAQAATYLNEALNIDPTNLIAAKGLLITEKVKKGKFNDEKKIFLKYHNESDADNFFLQQQLVDSLTPKWGGNSYELFKDARYFAANSPKSSRAPLLVLFAHWDSAEHFYSDNYLRYFGDPENWKECKEALDMAVQRFPESVEVRTLYLRTAMYARHAGVARMQYEKIKDRMKMKYWLSTGEMVWMKRALEMGIGAFGD
jgi:tetratricopeptide (TPR) repeat protein